MTVKMFKTTINKGNPSIVINPAGVTKIRGDKGC